ncbi:MAG: GNAT family N-acetyltransferase [Candidatus Dormibacteria bacterium]
MSSPFSVRPVTAHEYDDYGRCVALAFGGDYDPEEQARELALIPVEDTLAAFEGDRLVGTEGVYRMTPSRREWSSMFRIWPPST